MEKFLNPAPLGGHIAAVPSKSQAHRLLICAALADIPTEIFCPQKSEDMEATVRCLSALGAEISFAQGCYHVSPIRKVTHGALLDCGESGSTLRFLLPVAAALGANATFLMKGRLPQRPLSPLWEELERHGCTLSRPTPDTLRCEGRLKAGSYALDGNVSSQFISGLLFALPLLAGNSDIMLTSDLESAPYVDMTRAALSAFGVKVPNWDIAPQSYRSRGGYRVEGDWSNAAFWLCAGAISSQMQVTGLDLSSLQGDRKILDILKTFGAEVTWKENSVTVKPKKLRAAEIDLRQIPDLLPPLAVVAACAEGTTRFFGGERLRLKESDRLESVAQTLNALGGQAEVTCDGLLIAGGKLRGGWVDSRGDHRIAMMAAIASTLCAEPVILSGAEAVNKSYPDFWQDFEEAKL